MVKLGYTIAYVNDVNKAIAFFEKAFNLRKKFITAEHDYGELDTGNTTLAFASHALASTNFKGDYVNGSSSEAPLGIEIALVTDELESVYTAAIAHGATSLQSPVQKPWGQGVAYVRCPSGILLELCTPIPH